MSTLGSTPAWTRQEAKDGRVDMANQVVVALGENVLGTCALIIRT